MWYYRDKDAAVGPVSEEQIAELIRSGTLQRATIVWAEGMREWAPIGETRLASYLEASPPGGAVAPPPPMPPMPPMPGLPSSQARPLPRGFRNPETIATWVTAFLLLSLIISVVEIWSDFLQLDLLNRMVAHGFWTQVEAHDNDVRVNTLARSHLGVLIVTFIFFGRWIYVVAGNLRPLGAQRLQVTPGWAVGYYCVPVVNYWMPFVAMSEIWRASRAPFDWERQSAGSFLAGWWTLWVISNIAGLVLNSLQKSAHGMDQYHLNTILYCFWHGLHAILCIFATLLVWRVTSAQLKTAGARG